MTTHDIRSYESEQTGQRFYALSDLGHFFFGPRKERRLQDLYQKNHALRAILNEGAQERVLPTVALPQIMKCNTMGPIVNYIRHVKIRKASALQYWLLPTGRGLVPSVSSKSELRLAEMVEVFVAQGMTRIGAVLRAKAVWEHEEHLRKWLRQNPGLVGRPSFFVRDMMFHAFGLGDPAADWMFPPQFELTAAIIELHLQVEFAARGLPQ